MKSRNNGHIIIKSLLPALMCSVGFGLILSSGDVLGGLTGANGSLNTPNNSCSASTGTHTSTYCGIFGVSWRYYELDDPRISHLTNEVARCREEDTEGIHILAYELVDTSNGAVTKYHNQQVLSDANKFVQVKEVNQVPGGWKTFLSPDKIGGGNAEEWDDVKELWDYFKEAFTTSWEDTTWFCGNEDLNPRTGIVKANSGVSVDGVSGEKTGADVGPNNSNPDGSSPGKNNAIGVKVTTSKEQITGKIWHNQYYENISEGWSSVKQKEKKYGGITLDVEWDVKDGDVDACEGKGNCDYKWKVPAKETTAENTRIGQVNYTVKAGRKYCHTLTSEPLKFQFTHKEGIVSEAGRAHTTACVEVEHIDKPESPKDEFWATSSVEVPNATTQLGGYDPGKQTSEKDAAVELKISTDKEETTFKFYHNMSFDISDANHNIWRNREWDPCRTSTTDRNGNKVCHGGWSDWEYVGKTTDLEYSLTGDTGTVAEGEMGESYEYAAGVDETTQNQNEEVAEYTYTMTLQPGETKHVCHKIKYTPKTFTTPITEKLGWTGDWTIGPTWEYGDPQAGNDNEDSEACIEVTRPADPPEGDPYGPKNGGENDPTPMYAGEEASVSWNVTAKAVDTRRIHQYSAVGFVVNSSVGVNEGLNKSPHTKLNPCSYFEGEKVGLMAVGTQPNASLCNVFVGDNNDNLSIAEDTNGKVGDVEIKGVGRRIVVPDNVGAKYCVSFGYKWGYWWGVVKGETSNSWDSSTESWTHVPNKDYWTNYGSACRTIAKKPTAAVWNGSIFSSDSITSSTASRYNDANSDQPARETDNQPKTTFGSWAENLVVAGGNVNRFASAGAYGGGLISSLPGMVDGNNWNMAWQTISNSGLTNGGTSLGNSNIGYNSSYSTRLSAYLKSHAESPEDQNEYKGQTNVEETKILYFAPNNPTKTLSIIGDVILADTRGRTIYQMPQVVIYVDGNVAISNNVTRLDAWIIATGKVNTCSEWIAKETETRSLNRNQNAVCDNPLKINGPVIAGSVTLNRTYGADPLVYDGTGKNTSAEVFNLSALSYLWSFAQAGRYDSSYTDTYTRELAPRY